MPVAPPEVAAGPGPEARPAGGRVRAPQRGGGRVRARRLRRRGCWGCRGRWGCRGAGGLCPAGAQSGDTPAPSFLPPLPRGGRPCTGRWRRRPEAAAAAAAAARGRRAGPGCESRGGTVRRAAEDEPAVRAVSPVRAGRERRGWRGRVAGCPEARPRLPGLRPAGRTWGRCEEARRSGM